MVSGKLQRCIDGLLKGASALELAKWLFLIMPLVLAATGGLLMGMDGVRSMYDNPLTAVQLMLVFAMLFCYLLMKTICRTVKETSEKGGMLLPLWLMFLYQLSAGNLLCGFLILYGMFQEYGKGMLSIRSLSVTKRTKELLWGLLPLGLLYGLALFVKWRLNLL